MERRLQNLLSQISDLESKNQLIQIQIQDIIQTTKNMERTETDLNTSIESLHKEYESLQVNEQELISEIERVDSLCSSLEASLINETVSEDITAQSKHPDGSKSRAVDIHAKLDEANETVTNCILKTGVADDNMDVLLQLMSTNFIFSELSVEDLYEIYEKTKEMYHDSIFQKYCKRIVCDDYRHQCYFTNATHLLNMIQLLNEKLKEPNRDAHFNIANVCAFFGATEKEAEEAPGIWAPTELNTLLLIHKRHY